MISFLGKILIGGDEEQPEIIDLEMKSHCNQIPAFLDLDFINGYGATAGNLNGNGYYICYGEKCNLYQGNQKTAQVELLHPRTLSSSAYFQNSIYLVGGWYSTETAERIDLNTKVSTLIEGPEEHTNYQTKKQT